MMVRLAFSVMIQSDADILLIDEVLAVGDASFQQKCADVFREMRDAGRTIVLVTHDMAAVQAYCHRAMLIDDGELSYIGDPEEVAQAVLPAQLRQADGATPGDRRRRCPTCTPGSWGRGSRTSAGEPDRATSSWGSRSGFRIVIEACEELGAPRSASIA